MANDKPVIQTISAPETVNINEKFTLIVTVIDAEMVVTVYTGEIYSGEV